eukprot:3113987-Amphidinium_carterae.1
MKVFASQAARVAEGLATFSWVMAPKVAETAPPAAAKATHAACNSIRLSSCLLATSEGYGSERLEIRTSSSTAAIQ